MIEAMKQALDLIVKSKRYAEECSHTATQNDCDHFDTVAENLRKAIQEEALRNVQRIGQEIEQEHVSYLGNGTAGRENTILSTGFFFQMPKESQEQNFCPRCGKRTNDIHTCTPPRDNT